MLGAIYTALSGMNAFSQGLQTISDNVANLDTLGYKAQTVSFEDVFNEGGNGLDYTDGYSGESVGEGVSYGSPQTDFTAGTMDQTGGDLDMAVSGNGFLVVENTSGETYYTTTGQFAVDSQGYISDSSTGDRLTVLNSSNQAVPVNVNDYQTNAPVATSDITLTGSLASADTSAYPVTGITAYDSTGAAHDWVINLTPDSSGTAGLWDVSVTEGSTTIATGMTIQYNPDGGGPESSTNSNGTASSTLGELTFSYSPANAAEMSVTLDFRGTSSFVNGTTNTLQMSTTNGNAMGSLTGVSVSSSGELIASYSNSQTTNLGSVAIADFQNPQQLQQTNNGLFTNPANSTGSVTLQASGQGGVGTLESGEVEQSNVNLTSEFGDLILIQRGFDACSQIVSATNDMIQDLFGLRGHG